MDRIIKIGTRDSQLALWQAELVKGMLHSNGYKAELVHIKSEGDTDLQTPLYEIGVQGIFTKALDIALLKKEIDIAVHSMKDVPTQLAKGIITSAVLRRASYKDILVLKNSSGTFNIESHPPTTIATSSIRRKSQWLNKFPNDKLENLRGNVNTRLRKIQENNWTGAIFAAAGLERIGLRPDNAIDLTWMLPAPAQGAITVVCREDDTFCFNACRMFHDTDTAITTKAERDFLRALLGGCSTPISALAKISENRREVLIEGNILSLDGKQKLDVFSTVSIENADTLGDKAAKELLEKGGQEILNGIRNGK